MDGVAFQFRWVGGVSSMQSECENCNDVFAAAAGRNLFLCGVFILLIFSP